MWGGGRGRKSEGGREEGDGSVNEPWMNLKVLMATVTGMAQVRGRDGVGGERGGPGPCVWWKER